LAYCCSVEQKKKEHPRLSKDIESDQLQNSSMQSAMARMVTILKQLRFQFLHNLVNHFSLCFQPLYFVVPAKNQST
jgi:hypothetical protein